MIAYKFLAAGAVGPFTRFAWPVPSPAAPGRWIDAPDPHPEHGIHACRPRDLAFWVDTELWRAELAEPAVEGQRQVVSPRARLLEQVVAWDAAEARGFAEACLWRARDFSAEALRGSFPGDAGALDRATTLVALGNAAQDISSAGRSGTLAAALSGYLTEAIEFLEAGDPACAAYIAARTAVVASAGDESAFGAEREQQGLLLAHRLGLAPG